MGPFCSSLQIANGDPVAEAVLQDTAYHEAGHAVVGAIRDRAPISVTIISDGNVSGKNEFLEDWQSEFANHLSDSPAKRRYIETRVLTEVAGTLVHDMRSPGRAHDAADAYDERVSPKLIEENAGWADADRDRYFQQLQETAGRLLHENWPWVEAVANALIERNTISTADLMLLRPAK